MKHAWIGFVALLLFATAGCGSSHNTTPMDAGITFDATPPPDAGPEAATEGGPLPGPGEIGAMCTAGSDCHANFCVGEAMNGWPGGYCSQICGMGAAACPDGSTCVDVGGMTSLCLDNCDPMATERQCRHGYGCDNDFMLPAPVCVPGCTDDTDCSSGHLCDTTTPGGVCYDPNANLGDACASETDCPQGGFCYAERFSGYPGGECTAFGCDPAAGTGCPSGSVCEPGGFRGGLCVPSCTTDSDCRDGYRCKTDPDYPDRKYCGPGCTSDTQCTESGSVCNMTLGTCAPPFDATQTGQACTRRSCTGGTCLDESSTGFPGAYCTYIGCDATAPDATDGCPGTGVCFAMGSTDLCLAPCTMDSDCRDGYACQHRDPMDSSSPMACVPKCTINSQCTTTGDICNPGIGLCTQPFVPSNLGAPCAGPTDCLGGYCYSEAVDGWPGGTCADVGCSLSGSTPAEACPTGGVCVDDGVAPADIGVCLSACSPATSGTCRMGYACVALPSDSTMGACRPACTGDSDCSGGRTCDTSTGLCT